MDHLKNSIVSLSGSVYHASTSDLDAIAKLMNSLATSKSKFEYMAVSRATAMDLFAYSPLKLALLARIPDSDTITLYKCGDFIDLCRGPHVPHTGLLGASKLL
ncbi:54S ribosomal protein L39, mitochondrial, partial [Rhizoclosmatium hyalinum]